MRIYLLSLIAIILQYVPVFSQEHLHEENIARDGNVIITTITRDGEGDKKLIQIFTGEEDIQKLIDSLSRLHGEDNINIEIIAIPGMKDHSAFNWSNFEGLEDLEHILEMGDQMKWLGIEDLEDIRDLQLLEADKPFLGVIIDTDEKIDRGIRIMNIVKGSSAEAAGIQKDDILLSFDDHAVNSLNDLVDILADHGVGDEIELTYSSAGVESKTKATLKSRSENNYNLAKSFDIQKLPCCLGDVECVHHSSKLYQAFVHKQKPKLGVYIEGLDEEMIEDLKVASGRGVLVTRVIDDTAAKKMGLKVNDVLQNLNGVEIINVNSLYDILSEQKLGDEIEIEFLRYGLEKSAKGVLFEFEHHSAIDEMIFYRKESE